MATSNVSKMSMDNQNTKSAVATAFEKKLVYLSSVLGIAPILPHS